MGRIKVLAHRALIGAATVAFFGTAALGTYNAAGLALHGLGMAPSRR